MSQDTLIIFPHEASICHKILWSYFLVKHLYVTRYSDHISSWCIYESQDTLIIFPCEASICHKILWSCFVMVHLYVTRYSDHISSRTIYMSQNTLIMFPREASICHKILWSCFVMVHLYVTRYSDHISSRTIYMSQNTLIMFPREASICHKILWSCFVMVHLYVTRYSDHISLWSIYMSQDTLIIFPHGASICHKINIGKLSNVIFFCFQFHQIHMNEYLHKHQWTIYIAVTNINEKSMEDDIRCLLQLSPHIYDESISTIWIMDFPQDLPHYTPDSKVHGANMGPTWVLSAQMGPLLAPWILLSGTEPYMSYLITFNHQGMNSTTTRLSHFNGWHI